MRFLGVAWTPNMESRLREEVETATHSLLDAVRDKEQADARIALLNVQLERANKMLAEIERVKTQKGVQRP